jgi:hypothetical protein
MSTRFSYALIIIFLVTMSTPSQTRAQNVSPLGQCPNTPITETADASGCAASEKDADFLGAFRAQEGRLPARGDTDGVGGIDSCLFHPTPFRSTVAAEVTIPDTFVYSSRPVYSPAGN